MNTFSLKIGSTTTACETLGIQRINLQLKNLAPDTLTIDEITREFNAAPIMVYGDTVQLIETVGWVDYIRFIGTCTTNPRAGKLAKKEQRAYVCQNILWSLNKTFYEQDWHEDTTNTTYRGRVQLGRNIDNDQISIDAAITDVVGYAQNRGLSFTVNYAGLTSLPPSDEHVNISCWEAIRNLLRWAPSVASSVDYSTGTPVINFIKRSAATAAEFTATNLNPFVITPRNDLLLDGVVLEYEIANTIDGETFTTTALDSAGTTTGLDVLFQTINLFGVESSSTTQEVEIEVATVGDYTAAAFWQDVYPGLENVTDLVITSGTAPAELATLPRQLISGQIMDWMIEGGAGIEAAEAEFFATASFKLNGKDYTGIQLAHRMVLTDATSKTYTQVTSASYTPAEDVPTGLAAEILAARNALHYAGSFSTVGINPDWSATTTNVCNILPGTAPDNFDGLDNIDAVINSIQINITPAACSTAIQIGPPNHLGPQDIIEMARAARTRSPSVYNRKEPVNEDTALAVNGITRNENSSIIGSGFPTPVRGDILIADNSTPPLWVKLAIGAADTLLRSNGTDPAWLPDTLPNPDLGNVLIGDGTNWIATSPGADKTLLRSDGTEPAYDIAIEDGTATGQIMIWDTGIGGVGGIKAESLPSGNDGILIQSADGSISYMQGTSCIPFYDASGQPQTKSLPTTAGLLYYDGSGTFSAISIPSSGLLTGGGTSIGSESYILSGGYFTY